MSNDSRHPYATDFLLGGALTAVLAQVGSLLTARRVPGGRALPFLYGVGHSLFAVLVAVVVIGLATRFLKGRALWAARILFAAGLGVLLIGEDFVGVAERLQGPAWAWQGAMGALAGLLLLPIAWVGGRLRGKVASVALLVIAVGLAIGHRFALGSGYAGIHFLSEAAAALLVTSALGPIFARVPMRVAGGVALAGSVWAAASLAVPPDNTTLVAVLRAPGVGISTHVARVWAFVRRSTSRPAVEGDWLVVRSQLPPIPPSSPRLLDVRAPIVVFITIDSLRAEVLEDEAALERLPTLSKLKGSSLYFTNARSPSPATAPTMASLTTGRYYSQLHWSLATGAAQEKVALHQDAAARVSELLEVGGVDTYLVPGTSGFRQKAGLFRGFKHELSAKWSSESLLGAISKSVTKQKASRPAYYYVHLMEPHSPYQGRGKTVRDRYVGEIATVDRALGKFLASLDKAKLRDRTVVIISADHGEAFGEHGTTWHAVSVYEELLRVPLIVSVPGVAPRAIDTPVSLIDLPPTILDVFNLDTPGTFMGQSLVGVMQGSSEPLTRPLVADSGRRMQAMVFDDGDKIIRDLRLGTVELYNLRADPLELDNLSDKEPQRTQERLAILEAFFAAHTLTEPPGYEVPYRK